MTEEKAERILAFSLFLFQKVGTRPGACPMSAANNRLNLFNFEFNYTFERRSSLWAGTRPAPTLSLTAIVSPLIEICYKQQIPYFPNTL
jgi:hypothetical protein